MRLFHFSEDPDIRSFTPRAVSVPSPRPVGMEWLNGPLVWAIDDWHQPLYLFPRECPRILIWPTERTSAEDRASWWGDRQCRMVAHIERAWWDRFSTAQLFRYELPAAAFEPLNDAGMFVSRGSVEPLAMERITSLPTSLRSCDVELRLMERLSPLRDVWNSSMAASGIRLRNAEGWQGGT